MRFFHYIAGLTALLFSFQSLGNSLPPEDTLTYKVVPSPWSISVGGSLLTGMTGEDDPQVTFNGQTDVGVHYVINPDWMIGLQSSYVRYPAGVEPIRLGIRLQRNFTVLDDQTVYVAVTAGSHRSLQFNWWGGNTWMEGEKIRPFTHAQAGLQWDLPWMYVRTGMGYQIQHVYQEVDNNPWGGFSNEYRFRRVTWDVSVAFRLNKVFKI
ncbi:MAG: hypothetical protein AAFQ98_05530 [Bacteroidota bacterium]